MEVGRSAERLLREDCAQNVLKQRFLPKYIKEALMRILSLKIDEKEITEDLILGQIQSIKNEQNLSEEQLKIPTKNRMINKYRDPAEILQENLELRDMLLCRGCKLLEGTFANVSCGHLVCNNCCEVLTTCRICRKEIKDVIPILFWTNQSTSSC